VLVIGAYRDTKVGPDHPLRRALESVRTAGGQVQEVGRQETCFGPPTFRSSR
jgi:hypothetical protein